MKESYVCVFFFSSHGNVLFETWVKVVNQEYELFPIKIFN